MSSPHGTDRNDALVDAWSFVHLLMGVTLGWLMSPLAALAILILWEPLEIFIISPICARFGLTFGYETWRNSLSDIVFDTAGVAFSVFILTDIISPPFMLF